MREIDAKIGEFVERKIAAEDQLQRVDIRSPQDGTVFQLTVHTVGGVIAAGEAIMLIVPDADSLTVEARVNPQDIEQVQLDQKTVLRFPAFNAATTPEIDGQVSRISADISTDQRTGQSYYTIRISIPPDQLARLGNVRACSGHAGRMLHSNGRTDGDLLFAEASARPVAADIPGKRIITRGCWYINRSMKLPFVRCPFLTVSNAVGQVGSIESVASAGPKTARDEKHVLRRSAQALVSRTQCRSPSSGDPSAHPGLGSSSAGGAQA